MDPVIDPWIAYGPQSQSLWLILESFLLAISTGNINLINRASSKYRGKCLLNLLQINPKLKRRSSKLFSLLTIYFAFYVLLSVLSGSFDRQLENYFAWSERLWRLDTPIAAFSRLRDMWFLLLPLFFRLSCLKTKILQLILLVSFFAAALFSGSRGLLFYPSLLLVAGLWLVSGKTTLLRNLLLSTALSFLLLSPLIQVMREMPSFRGAESLGDRIDAVQSAIMNPQKLTQKALWIGRDLYACHDPYFFDPSNQGFINAGSSGLSSLKYLFVPRHIYPDQPPIFDGHIIAKNILGVTDKTYGSQAWFPCISLPGDLYRRWGLNGVIIGAIFVGATVAVILRSWYLYTLNPNNSFQFLVLIYPCTYLQGFPFGTVSETMWYLLWDLVKYLVLFWIIAKLVDANCRQTDSGG